MPEDARVKFTWFNLMPWPYLPDDFREKNRSIWVDIDQRLFDPVKSHAVYNTYMDLLEYADTLGFDGIGVNEHHQNGYGIMPSPNIIAAGLARRTSNAAMVVLGNSIALYNPPVRVAEEFAMLDCISGGRLVAGFPVGTSMDTNYCYGQIPALTREKYAEAHDLIIKAWTEREPFAFNGRYNKLRHVNIWPRPIQQPHPPIHIPGGGSVETYDFCIDNTYSYSYLSFTGYIRAKALLQGYWDRVAASATRRTPRPIAPASPRPSAWPIPTRRPRGSTRKHVHYFYNRCLHVYPGFADAPGYRTIKTIQSGALSQYAPPKGFGELTWKDLTEGGHVIAGIAGDRPSADGGDDQGAQRRQHLLPDAHGRHAGRKVHDLDQALRREGDAQTARRVPGVRGRHAVLVQPDRSPRQGRIAAGARPTARRRTGLGRRAHGIQDRRNTACERALSRGR